jgi:hypothetical protein
VQRKKNNKILLPKRYSKKKLNKMKAKMEKINLGFP